jgi:hypothetical protein
MWLLLFGVEQPQQDNFDTMMITYRLNNRFNVLPPWRCNRHGRQAANRVTPGRHQH